MTLGTESMTLLIKSSIKSERFVPNTVSKMIIFKPFKPPKDGGIQPMADVTNHKAAAGDGLEEFEVVDPMDRNRSYPFHHSRMDQIHLW